MKVLQGSGHSRSEEARSRGPVNAQRADIPADSDLAPLVARCRGGDATAWRQLYDAHYDFVLGAARRLGIPTAELDDVLQESFLVAFRKLDAFRDGRFSTWLFRIVANVVSNKHRRRRIRDAFAALLGRAEPQHQRGPDRDYDAREAHAAVSDVLARMAPKKREVFALFELEGLTGEEVAERVGCRVETVWTRLHYARADFERIARKRGVVP